eukprot:8840386-Alexandrium_andersonii.AAC.1
MNLQRHTQLTAWHPAKVFPDTSKPELAGEEGSERCDGSSCQGAMSQNGDSPAAERVELTMQTPKTN